MSEADALDIVRGSVWTALMVASPAVVAAMLVGLVISLLQALTQIQEMTLTFVPKILVVLIVLMVTAPFMGAEFFLFSEALYARIEAGF